MYKRLFVLLAVAGVSGAPRPAGAKKHHDPAAAAKVSNAPVKKAASEQPATVAKKAPPAQPEPVEKIEEIEQVEAVEPDKADSDHDASGPSGKPTTVLETLPHLHAALVHMPIAWVMLLFLAEVAALALGRVELLAVGPYLSVLAVLAFLPAGITGLLRFDELAKLQDPSAIAPALVHRNVMYGCAAVCLLAAVIRVKYRVAPPVGIIRWAYLGLVFIALALVGLGGHMGGKLVYGDDFLPF